MSKRFRMMYKGSVVVMWLDREERLSAKEEDLEGMVVTGVRASFSMVTRRPKREESLRSVLNWETSSWEADIPDCIVADVVLSRGFEGGLRGRRELCEL